MDTISLPACPIARAASLIGDEWIMLLLRELFQGPQKFDELQKKTGVSTNILSNRLNRMIDSGILSREPYQERPPRYAYRLTKAGLALLPVVLELMRYAEEWMPSEQAPPLRLRHTTCGRITRAGQFCSECGEPVTLKTTRLERGEAAQPDAG